MGCGASRQKSELIRFVRAGEAVERDLDGIRPGRGAYICPSADCARLALRRRGFDRALRGRVANTEDVIHCMEEWQRNASMR